MGTVSRLFKNAACSPLRPIIVTLLPGIFIELLQLSQPYPPMATLLVESWIWYAVVVLILIAR